MTSETPSVSHARFSAAAGAAAFLICMWGMAFAGADSSGKKTIKSVKPVFSVSVPDSMSIHPAAHPSASAATAKDSAVRKTDTAHHAAGAAPAGSVKDSTHTVPLPETQQTAVRPGPKTAADTITAEAHASVAKSPAKIAVPQKKQKPFKHMFLFRIIIFLGSIVLIAAAIRFVKKQKSAPRFLTTTRLSVMDKEVQLACRYIEKNFADPDLSVKNVCQDLVTGEAFLEALMERELGVTVGDFISHVRINKAKQILAKDPSAGSDAIARETGFANSAVFLAVFKKLTGTPFEMYADQRRKT